MVKEVSHMLSLKIMSSVQHACFADSTELSWFDRTRFHSNMQGMIFASYRLVDWHFKVSY